MDDAREHGRGAASAPHRMTVDAVASALGTDARRGLPEVEARARLERAGPNDLAIDAPTPWWKRLLAQFSDILVVLLLIAAAVSFSVWLIEGGAGYPYEALAIVAVVILNAMMGYVQEARAESAVAALRAMAASAARVVRDGAVRSVPPRDLVPGDLIAIEEGAAVPADARLVEAVELQAAEAALTGESLPVSKDVGPLDGDPPLGDRRNMLYSGTVATHGHATAIVTATGMQTEMGRIAALMKEAAPVETTPLEEELHRVGKLLGTIVVAIAVVMIVTIFLVQGVGGTAGFLHVLVFGVALAVAAVPEGLPAVLTAVLAIGVRRLARLKAIVTRLAAVETLGSASVIASDKTGTLTRNEMTVRRIVTASGHLAVTGTGYAPEGETRTLDGSPMGEALREEVMLALTAADRANNTVVEERDGDWAVEGDPTEGALRVAARKGGVDPAELDARFERVGEIPFSSERKLMSTVHRDSGGRNRVVVFTKGAPDVLLERCTREQVGREPRPLDQGRRAAIMRTNEDLAGEAFRTLGVASRVLEEGAGDLAAERVERELTFLGLLAMIDPPRDEAADAVARTRTAGIRPIMITGDHPKTAAVIAGELGISDGEAAVTGAELEAMSDAELASTARKVSVYARVDPAHKLRIVRALQSEAGGGETVAMTGDGVNDAPALKAADIGIAMGITGTDVSKQAADVVLADDNFATIVRAVEGGRSIYANIRKFLRYLLSSNVGEVLMVFFGVLLSRVIGLRDADAAGVVVPLVATQILWINLVTDVAPAMALGLEPADDVMRRRPRRRSERVITPRMWFGIVLVGMVMAAGTLLVLDAALPGGLIPGDGTLDHARTMAFTTLVLFQLFNLLSARSDVRSAFHRIFSNPWLWGAIGVSLLLQIAAIYTPVLQRAFSTTALGFGDWLVCAAVASSVLWIRELAKLVYRGAAGAGHRRAEHAPDPSAESRERPAPH